MGLRSRIRIRRRRIRQDGVGRVRGWVTVGSQGGEVFSLEEVVYWVSQEGKEKKKKDKDKKKKDKDEKEKERIRWSRKS